MKDDSSLVEQAIAGDSSAFAELYERYFDRVYDFLARMVRDQQQAADLAQDTFLRAMNGLNGLAKGGSFKSWLFTIARNTALNHIERASRSQPLDVTDDEGEGFAMDVVDTDRFGNPEEAAEVQSLAGLVWEAAKALGPNQYSLLDLSVRQGLESAEIAEVLGVTKNNAYVMVNRMKKTLEEAIGALMLFRDGRRNCAELNRVLTALGVPEMSVETRRVVERHASSCATCTESRSRLTSPFAILGGFAALTPELGTRGRILEELQTTFPYNAGGSTVPQSPDGTGSPESQGPGNDPLGATRQQLPSALPPQDFLSQSEPLAHPEGDAGPSKRRRALAAAGVAVLVLLLGGVGVRAFGKNEPAPTPLAVVGTQAPAVVTTATVLDKDPTAELPPTPEVPPTSQIEPADDENPIGAPGTPGPSGGPVPVMPGPNQPPLTAPTDGGGGNPPGGGTTGGTNGSVTLPPGGTGAGGGSSGSGSTGPRIVQPVDVTPPPARCVAKVPSAPASVSFGPSESVKTIQLTATETCGSSMPFQVQPGSAWITPLPAGGSLGPGGVAALTIRIDRGDLVPGNNNGRIRITTAAGNVDVQVVATVVRITIAPTVTRTPPPFQLVPHAHRLACAVRPPVSCK